MEILNRGKETLYSHINISHPRPHQVSFDKNNALLSQVKHSFAMVEQRLSLFLMNNK